MKNLYDYCPSFDTCLAPKCPLDEDYEKYTRLSGEDKCKALKKTRLQIVKDHPEIELKFGGFTPKEFNGHRLAGRNDG